MKIKGYMIISLLIVVFFLVLEEDVSANGQLEFELAMSIYPRQGLASEIEKLESEIEERVGTCEDYFELGKLYLQNLDFEKAEASFDEVLRLDPESMDYREEIARFYIEKMMFSKAVEIYLELGEIDPSAKGKYYTEIAKIYENRRNFDRALEYWQKVVESEESNPKLHIQLAEEYIRNERYEEAQAEYRRAIELAPDNYDYRLKLAKFYETHKRYEEAISQYEAILSRDKFNEDGLRNLFNLLVNLAELEEIFSELKQKVAGDPADSPSLLRLAQIYEYKGEHLKASIEYKNWAKVDPEGGSRWLEVGDIFIRLRMFAEASRVFMKVLLEYPDRWDERALFGLNESYLYQFTPLDTVLAEGDLLPGFMDENSEPDLLGGAVSVLFSNLQDPLQDFGVMRNRYFNQALGIEGMKRFIAEYPESDLGDDAYLKIATAYYEMRRFSEAIAEYRILLEEYPHPKFDDLSLLGVKRGNYSSVSTEDMDPAGLVLMRIADCYEQMKRYREAIATYRTILERFSTDETQRKLRREALDSIIDIYTRQKRYQEAVSEYKEEIRRDRSPELYKKLGNYVKSNLGYFAAIEVYEEAQAEFSESLDFVRSLGWLYIYNNYDQKAVDLYERYQFLDKEIQQRLFETYSKYMMLPMILKEVQRELLTDPDNPQLNKIEGDIYIWESRFEEAVPLYEKLVELIPYREEFRITLAKLYRSFGDYRSAAEQYAKLTMIDPYNKNYRITRGDILAQGEMRDEEERISPPEEAKEAWESIIETDPNDLSLYKELAAIYWDYYMFDEAIQSILRAREVSRNENLFAGELAALYELKGAYTQAIDEYIRILETGQEPESGHYYDEYTPTERKLLYLIDEEEMFPLIEERFEKAIASRPTSGKLYLELARLYLYLEKSDKALSTYQRGSEAIEDIDFHLNLADIYGGYRRFDLQERELLYVVEKRPKDITYLGLLAGFYMNRERYDKASEICRRMVEIEPAEESHRASLAKALLELEEFEEAEEIYLALVEADPTNISYYTQLAIAYYRQGRGEEGIEIYNRGIKRLSQDESLKNAMNTLKVRQIYLYSALGMYIDGLAAYERMINKEPLVEWILDSAYRLAKEHNLLDKLISYYQEVSAEAHRNYRWNVVLYRIFMKENRYQEALLQLEKAVGLEPSLVWLRQELAEQYRRLGKYQKAVEQYEEIIFLGGEPWSWYEAIGYTYAEAGDLENAKVWWAKLAERSPNEPYTHSKLASLYERYRLFDDAIAGYEKAAKLAEARKNYSLGFYESIGRVYEAQRDYMKAIDIYISLYGRSSSSYSRERYLEMIFDVYEKLDNLNSVIEGYQKNLPANLSNVAYLKLFARICLLQNNYEKALELYKRALEIASSDKADPYSAIADIYLPRKMYKEAIEIYNKLLLLNPAEGGYYGHIGECYFELGDETEACLYWQSIPDLGERDPMRYGQLGEIYFREGMYREAKEQLSKALFLAESYQKGTYYEQLGEIYFAEGDKDKAVETWRKIVEANPEDAQLYFRLADVFRDHKLYLPAVSALEEVLLLYRGKEYHYRWRDADEEIDNIYEEAKRFDLLIAKYKERIANPITEDEYRDYLNYLNLLSAYNKNGDYQSAITTAKEALTILEKEISESELLVREVIQTDGKRIKLLSELAKAYKESRDYEKAIDTYELLLDLDPQNNFHYVNLGEIYFAQGDKEKALAIWRKMVEVNPNQSSTYQQLAETLDKYEFYGEAEESWRKAIILDPNIMLYRYNLAETLFLERNYQSAIAIYLELLYISDDLEIRKKAEEGLFKAYVEGNLLDSAIAEFSERVQHLPELVEPRLALGLAYQLKGEFDRALAVYQEAQGVDPYNLEGHFQLAVIYRIKGDSYEADRELKRLFMLNPERYEDFERRYKKRLAELGITYKPYEMPEPKLLIALRSYAPAWSPDGKRIAFHSALVEGENSDIWVYDLETGRSTQLTNTPGSDRFASWSPDGEWVTFQTQDESGKWGIWKVRTDAGSLSKIIADEKFSYHDPAWSKVGNWIAFYSNIRGNYDIWMVNPEGRMLTQLTQESFSDRSPSWSSEGKKIAFQSNRDGTNEIWVLDVESGAFEQITDNDRNNDMPAFSPDGGKIAFFSNASGDWDIWMINIDGTGARRLTDEAGIDFNPVWSPDGKRIAFESNRGGKNQIWVIEIAEDS